MAASSRTILLVDDEPEEMQSLAACLAKEGFEALLAASGDEALRLLETCRPFLLIADLEMPEMNGYELLEQYTHNPESWKVAFMLIHTQWNDDFSVVPAPLNRIWQPTPSGRIIDFYWPKPLVPLEEVTKYIHRIHESLAPD